MSSKSRQIRQYWATAFKHMSHNMRKPTMWILTRSDTNQAVQPLEMPRGLEILDLGRRGIVLFKQRKQRRWSASRFISGQRGLEILQQQSGSMSSQNKTFCQLVKPAFQENCAKSSFSAQAERLRNKTYYIYLGTLKLQLFSSNSVKFDLSGPFNKWTLCPWRDQVSKKLMSLPTDHFINGCIRWQIRDFKG